MVSKKWMGWDGWDGWDGMGWDYWSSLVNGLFRAPSVLIYDEPIKIHIFANKQIMDQSKATILQTDK